MQQTTPSVVRTRAKALRRGWKILNSNVFLALLISLAVLLLGRCYAVEQAKRAEVARRTAELEGLIVELDLRASRLQVACYQAQAPHYTPQERQRVAQRAKAIVSGQGGTVTGDPASHGAHLVTLMGRAESAAGLRLSPKGDLPTFTDMRTDVALRATPAALHQLDVLVRFLQDGLAIGRTPALGGLAKGRLQEAYVRLAKERTIDCWRGPVPKDADPATLSKRQPAG